MFLVGLKGGRSCFPQITKQLLEAHPLVSHTLLPSGFVKGGRSWQGEGIQPRSQHLICFLLQVAGRLHVEVMRLSGAIGERIAGGDDPTEVSSEKEVQENRLVCMVSQRPLLEGAQVGPSVRL